MIGKFIAIFQQMLVSLYVVRKYSVSTLEVLG